MVNITARTLRLVIAAIKNLGEIKGSTTREILNYVTSVYNLAPQVARRQMQTALKRGVAYGILRKNGGHYVLPTGTKTGLTEIAAQELGLLDLSVRKRRSARRSKRSRRTRPRKRTVSKLKRMKRSWSKARRSGRIAAGQRRTRKRRSRMGKTISANLSKHVLRTKPMKPRKARLTRGRMKRTKYANKELRIEAERSLSDGHSSCPSIRSL